MKYQQRTTVNVSMVIALLFAFAPTAPGQLPNPGMEIDPANTALVITDPQNDFLSPEGVTWHVVGKNVEETGTVENLETLFKLAKSNGIQVFISPHYYFPTDKGWQFEGALERRCTIWACSTARAP